MPGGGASLAPSRLLAQQAAEDRAINEGYARYDDMQSNRYFAIYGND